MKPDRAKKAEQKLESLESQLREALLEHLPHAVRTSCDLLSTDNTNPEKEFTQALRSKALECVVLRESLVRNDSNSVSARYLQACAESDDKLNEQRRGPQRLAQWLLDQLNH
jgi:S-adenosylmethionine:tRNA-ribosyltransferase-isomerase (queuine synthetase)